MVFASALFTLALAASAVAIPSSAERHAARVARRANRSGNVRLPAQGPTALTSNSTNAEFSSNWSGAVKNFAAGTVKSVTGTFVVPTPKEPSGSSGTHSASAWVGIDGDTCGTAILQTGIDFNVNGGSTSYDAWFEYFPAAATDFSGITISAGNTITLTVTATSTTSGTVSIENVSTGKTVSKTLSSSAKLCEQDAEWIVEDFEEGNSLVPFANFGTVTFTNTGGTTTASGATLIDIQQNGQTLTSASLSGSNVVVTYQ